MPGAMPGSGYCHTSVASIQHHNMMIYQPKCETLYRVTWYGGESTILRFEKKISGEWKELSVQTLMYGIPTGIKELYQEMQDVYNYGITMEQDSLVGTIF
jgi:ubiquinone/menaquinone biosynthesis C-methylase UbiE